MKLAEVLNRHMKAHGTSLSKLAKKSGISKQTIYGWTTGRKVQDISQLKKVANALEISIHELLYDEPDPFESKSHEILKELFRGDIRVTIHKIDKK